MADCACEAISDSGIGVGTGFVGLGLTSPRKIVGLLPCFRLKSNKM